MRKLIFVISFISLLFVSVVLSHGHESTRTLDQIVANMLTGQGVSSINQIDCSKVSVLDFEDLGNTIMERMVGNHELHEQMDEMMGGEGSESLRQMHIVMGKNWVGCGNDSAMMNNNMMLMMMGNYYPGYYTSYNTVLIFGVIGWILFLASIVIFVLKPKKRRK